MDSLKEIASCPECVAIGECGLDFNRNFSPQDVQLQVFEEQVTIALLHFNVDKSAAARHKMTYDPQLIPSHINNRQLEARGVTDFFMSKEKSSKHLLNNK